MTHPPSPEARWTPGPWHEDTSEHLKIVSADGEDVLVDDLLRGADRRRIVQSVNACQSIPGDPEMALRLAREALRNMDCSCNGTSCHLMYYPECECSNCSAYRTIAKSLGYDGGEK